VGELISKGEKELLSLRNFGERSKQELEERLEVLGLSLNPQGKPETPQPEETTDLAGEEVAAEESPSEETGENQPEKLPDEETGENQPEE